MNPKEIVTEEQGTYPVQSERGFDGAKPQPWLLVGYPRSWYGLNKASAASFNAEIPPSCLFAGRWDPAFMAKTRGGCGGTVWREGRVESFEL